MKFYLAMKIQKMNSSIVLFSNFEIEIINFERF